MATRYLVDDMRRRDVKPYFAAVVAGLLLACPARTQCRTSLPQKDDQSTAQGQNSPELAEAEQLSAQVSTLFKDRQYDKALPLAERVLAIREKVLGPDHPLVASALRNLAEILFAKGRRKEALSTYGRYITASEKTLGKDSPKLIEALDHYVCLLVFSGQRPEALEVQKRLYKLDNGFDYDESPGKSGAARLAAGGLMVGKLISSPAPVYPAEAKAGRVTGSVVMKVTVDETGRVLGVNTLCGHPLLAKGAEESVRKARYTPTSVAGKSVRVTGIAIYNFVFQ
jgi:TonB family protein